MVTYQYLHDICIIKGNCVAETMIPKMLILPEDDISTKTSLVCRGSNTGSLLPSYPWRHSPPCHTGTIQGCTLVSIVKPLAAIPLYSFSKT